MIMSGVFVTNMKGIHDTVIGTQLHMRKMRFECRWATTAPMKNPTIDPA
jgi:hypothetical protein